MVNDPPAEEGGAAPPRAAAGSSGNRVLLWAGILTGVLLAAAAAVTFTRDAALDPETPEGVVQSYLSAMIDGRRGKARTYLSDRLRRECILESSYYLRDGSYRIEWLDTNIEGQTAYVDVRVTEERFLEPSYPHYQLFVLAYQEDGEDGGDGGSWRIINQNWPRHRCSEELLPPPDPDAGEV